MESNFNLINKTFGKLTVIKYSHLDKYRNKVWLCNCDCGGQTTITTYRLKAGIVKSCGCLYKYSKRKAKGLSGFNKVREGYKYQAKKRDLIFELTNEDLKILFKSHCVYCGIEPKQKAYVNNVTTQDAKNHSEFIYNGIDRINPELGYIRSNVVTCCKRCNFMKNDLNFNEFIKHIERIIQFCGKKI